MPDPQPLTPAEIAEAKAMCEAATPEPWRLIPEDRDLGLWDVIAGEYADEGEPDLLAEFGHNKEDAKFAARARTLLPRALATIEAQQREIERLRAENERLRAERDQLDTLAATYRVTLCKLREIVHGRLPIGNELRKIILAKIGAALASTGSVAPGGGERG